MDAITLARMQFAANITFHILFPTITIALGWVLLFLRWRYLRAAAADVKQAESVFAARRKEIEAAK